MSPNSQNRDSSMATQLAINSIELKHITEKIDGIKDDVDVKHKQNRTSIHELKNDIQSCVDLITGIRIANARWNIIAGVITALLTTLIHYLLEKH